MRYCLCFCLLTIAGLLCGQSAPDYQNSDLPIEARVADLLRRMSPDEKLHQLFMVSGGLGKDSTDYLNGLFGYQVFTSSAAGSSEQMMHYSPGHTADETRQEVNRLQRRFMEESRLGIPIIAYDEALHGLVRSDATAYPQSIALAATFDTQLMKRVATAIAGEMRTRGLRMVLSPVLNIATDVRWGRTEETYGEDPLLAARMGLAYIRTMEKSGIVTCPKHFVLNHGDGGRDSYPVFTGGGYFHDSYLLPFRTAIREGGARSIMTAYNSYLGRPCSANAYLLQDLLRKTWGFSGFVISDAGATGGANVLHFTAQDYADAGAQSIRNGQDVIFQTDLSSYPLFRPLLDNGMKQQASLDSAVAHVLRIKFALGLFEEPLAITMAEESSGRYAWEREIAYEAAVKSAVLLRNEEDILPLSSSYKKIAVIGQDAIESRLGGYSGPGVKPISILDGLKKAMQDKAVVSYSPGCGRNITTHRTVEASCLFHHEGEDLKPGLHAKYYTGIDTQASPVFERSDAQVDFQWTLFGPDPRLPYDHYSVVWEGLVIPDESGDFEIGVEGNDGYQLYLNDALYIDRTKDPSYHITCRKFRFEKGKSVRIRIVYQEKSGNAKFKLIWNKGVKDESEQAIAQAVEAAAHSDVAIVVVGIEEGEFRDRSSLALPGKQEEMIRRIAATGKPVIVLIVGGSAVTMEDWISSSKAILQVWYPGEAGGEAIADLLTGAKNPSGKLPITFPMREGQLPLVYNHLPTGRGDDYVDGSGQPLFPFGFGLSYTDFTYSNLTLSSERMHANEEIEVRFTLTNAGKLAGDEVVQIYLRDEVASIAQPVKKLIDFQRVHLEAGESKEVRLTIRADQLAYSDNEGQPVLENGSFRLMIGSSSRDIQLRQIIELVK